MSVDAEDAWKIDQLSKALMVMVLDTRISAFLVEHDPQALRQALDALDVPEAPRASKTAWPTPGSALLARVELLAERSRAESLADVIR